MTSVIGTYLSVTRGSAATNGAGPVLSAFRFLRSLLAKSRAVHVSNLATDPITHVHAVAIGERLEHRPFIVREQHVHALFAFHDHASIMHIPWARLNGENPFSLLHYGNRFQVAGPR